MRLWIFKI